MTRLDQITKADKIERRNRTLEKAFNYLFPLAIFAFIFYAVLVWGIK